MNLQEERDEKGKLVNPYIKGVWFEKEYQRQYPYGKLASSVIGSQHPVTSELMDWKIIMMTR